MVQRVQIWRRNVKYDDLISACSVWCDTSRADVVRPILLEKVNKIGCRLVHLNVYQSVVTNKRDHSPACKYQVSLYLVPHFTLYLKIGNAQNPA